MVAKIAGFHSRAELGMPAPKSRSTNITPQHGGVAVHWGGPKQHLGNHDKCKSIWLSWLRYHVNSHGWVDIAYSFGFCNHGYVLAGRGFGVRTAANGTNHGNQNYYAAVWIGGSGDSITQAAYDALEWIVLEARTKGGAGNDVVPHRTFTGSECPGTLLIRFAAAIHRQSIRVSVPTPTPTPPPAQQTPFERWWNSLNTNQQQALEGLADRILELGPEGNPDGTPRNWGSSFGLQTYRALREKLPKLDALVTAVEETMDTTMKAFGEHGVAILRELSTRGLRTVSPGKVRKNKSYTKEELGIK